ncbi:hypothetical protein H0H93_007990 [Arthromyces matolae]|nr:hypothetical protein H0H93_007990 [Arthromyces matolae]
MECNSPAPECTPPIVNVLLADRSPSLLSMSSLLLGQMPIKNQAHHLLRVAIVLLLSVFIIRAAPAGEPTRRIGIEFLLNKSPDHISSAPLMHPPPEDLSSPVVQLPSAADKPSNPGNVDVLSQSDTPVWYNHQEGEPNLDQLPRDLSQKLKDLNDAWGNRMNDEQRKETPFWKWLAYEAQSQRHFNQKRTKSPYMALFALSLQEESMKQEIDTAGKMKTCTLLARIEMINHEIARFELKSREQKLAQRIRREILWYVRTHSNDAEIPWKEKSGKLDQTLQDAEKIVETLSQGLDPMQSWARILKAAFWQINTAIDYSVEGAALPSSYELLLGLELLKLGTEKELAARPGGVSSRTVRNRLNKCRDLVTIHLQNDEEARRRGQAIGERLQQLTGQAYKASKAKSSKPPLGPTHGQDGMHSDLLDGEPPSKRMRI